MRWGTFFDQVHTAYMEKQIDSMDHAFAELAEKGLSFVDMTTALYERYEGAALLQYLNGFGIDIATLFHWFVFDYQRQGILKEMEDAKVQLDRCAKLGSPVFMPVPCIFTDYAAGSERIAAREQVLAYLGSVCELAKPYGIQVVLENYSDTRCPFSTLADMQFFLKALPDLRYVLDTGNFWFGGADVLEACDLFYGRTEHIHLKDLEPKENSFTVVCGKACDSVTIGDGILPMEEILRRMHRSGYDKTVTVEINHRDDLIPKIKKSLDFLNRIKF